MWCVTERGETGWCGVCATSPQGTWSECARTDAVWPMAHANCSCTCGVSQFMTNVSLGTPRDLASSSRHCTTSVVASAVVRRVNCQLTRRQRTRRQRVSMHTHIFVCAGIVHLLGAHAQVLGDVVRLGAPGHGEVAGDVDDACLELLCVHEHGRGGGSKAKRGSGGGGAPCKVARWLGSVAIHCSSTCTPLHCL